MQDSHFTDPSIAPSNSVTQNHSDTSQDLTAEEKSHFIPVFKRLVNMKPIQRDFKHGRLCRHSGKTHLLEKVGIEEIHKVVEQVRIIDYLRSLSKITTDTLWIASPHSQ